MLASALGGKTDDLSGDIMNASRELRPPHLPHISTLHDVNLEDTMSGCHTEHLAEGFTGLLSLQDASAQVLLKALQRLAAYVASVEAYLNNVTSAPTVGILAEQREFVQHSMLRLSDVFEHSQPHSPLLKLCHRAGLVFSFTCVFPSPAAPFDALAKQIKACFQTADLGETRAEFPTLIVWVLFMGGIAASGTEHRLWYTVALDRCIRRIDIETWDMLRTLLMKHLWLPRTNDVDGIKLWNEIMASDPWEI